MIKFNNSSLSNSFKILVIFLFTFLFSCTTSTKYKQLIGIDISHYQDDINWKSVKKTKISFAIVKATEGSDWQDEYFEYNWKLLKEARLIRGAYHFLNFHSDAKTQFDNYQKLVNLKSGDLAPIIDLEYTKKLPKSTEIRSKLRKWLRLAEKHYKTKPIIYTGESFYNSYLSGYFPGYPLWIAKYAKKPPQLNDDSPWHIWQYTDKGKVSGIDHKVDLNYFAGNEIKIQKLLIP